MASIIFFAAIIKAQQNIQGRTGGPVIQAPNAKVVVQTGESGTIQAPNAKVIVQTGDDDDHIQSDYIEGLPLMNNIQTFYDNDIDFVDSLYETDVNFDQYNQIMNIKETNRRALDEDNRPAGTFYIDPQGYLDPSSPYPPRYGLYAGLGTVEDNEEAQTGISDELPQDHQLQSQDHPTGDEAAEVVSEPEIPTDGEDAETEIPSDEGYAQPAFPGESDVETLSEEGYAEPAFPEDSDVATETPSDDGDSDAAVPPADEISDTEDDVTTPNLPPEENNWGISDFMKRYVYDQLSSRFEELAKRFRGENVVRNTTLMVTESGVVTGAEGGIATWVTSAEGGMAGATNLLDSDGTAAVTRFPGGEVKGAKINVAGAEGTFLAVQTDDQREKTNRLKMKAAHVP